MKCILMKGFILIFWLLIFSSTVFSQTRQRSGVVSNVSDDEITFDLSRVAPVENTDAAIEDLIRNFFVSGSCLEIRNINSQSAVLSPGNKKDQIGKFQQQANLDVGFTEGILLSSGNVAHAVGPNNRNADTSFGGQGTQESYPNDEVFIEFEFKPTGDEISFQYVFASEEYPDDAASSSYVCEFNDFFSFYLRKASDPADQEENIALIPGTTLPVTIDNLNNMWNHPNADALDCLVGDYSQYYVSNFPSANPNDPSTQELVYDGYTVPLTATKSNLDACEWYYMKIVVSDGGSDTAFDTAVFLEANSFADNSPLDMGSVGTVNGTEDAEESCKNGYFLLERAGDNSIDDDYTVELNVTGTATSGVDFEALPTTVTIPAGQESIQIPIVPIYDEEVEGTETVVIEATNISCGCMDTSISASINIIDFTQSRVSVTDTFCTGNTYNLPDGTEVTSAGDYDVTIPRLSNPQCDSLLLVQLTETAPPNSSNSKLQSCSEDNTGQFTLSNADGSVTTETGVDITYHASIEDAQSGENPLPDNYSSGTTVVYVRVENQNLVCWSTAEVELEVVSIPEDREIGDEQICDNDEDGAALFNLTPKVAEALGSQSASDYTVSFHLTDNQAQNDTDAITDITNFQVTSDPQTIYIRVENNLNESCQRVLPFTFSYFENPEANDVPIAIPTCSLSSTATFNLDDIALEVADGVVDNTVDFFEDAAATIPITNTAAYVSATRTIYGRVTNPTTGCFAFGEVQLDVLGTPQRSDQPFTLCASSMDNSEANFDLTTLNSLIIGNMQNVTVTYHTTFDDANANVSGGQSAIPNPTSYDSATAIIYARSEASYGNNFCHTVSEITLTVNPRPSATSITIQNCVERGTESTFDLSASLSDITTDTGVTVTFYTDSATQNQITDVSNYTSESRTIYAKVDNDMTNCSETAAIQLEVIEIPKITEEIELTLCKTNEVAVFNLAALKTQLENQYSDLEFSFFQDEALSQALGASHSIDASQTIYARYDLVNTPCFNSDPVTLNVTATPFEDRGDAIVCVTEGFQLPDGTIVYEPGEYEVIIQDSEGCDILTKTKLIVADIEFASAFAPNGNGANESFGALPNNACVGDVSDYHLMIYNRWGEKVYETTNFIDHWDGKFGGELQEGTYLWQATYTFQGEQFDRKGTIILLF